MYLIFSYCFKSRGFTALRYNCAQKRAKKTLKLHFYMKHVFCIYILLYIYILYIDYLYIYILYIILYHIIDKYLIIRQYKNITIVKWCKWFPKENWFVPLLIAFHRYILPYFSLILVHQDAISNGIFYHFTLYIAFFVVI